MQNPGSRGYRRKGVEALTAPLLTARYGGEDVLRHYLRIVPYGNRIHGIAYAARRYFDKPVEDLSLAEIAFLSALPQAPSTSESLHAGKVQSSAPRAQGAGPRLARERKCRMARAGAGPPPAHRAAASSRRARLEEAPCTPSSAWNRCSPKKVRVDEKPPISSTPPWTWSCSARPPG